MKVALPQTARFAGMVGRLVRVTALIAILNLLALLKVAAQPLPSPDPPTPQQAYRQLLRVRTFAFGGIGYAGRISDGELAYHAIAGSTNALILFSAVLTNGNAQAQLYALCGIRQFAPGAFDTHASALRTANPRIETMSGCLVNQEFATNVVARIASGSYDVYLKKPKR